MRLSPMIAAALAVAALSAPVAAASPKDVPTVAPITAQIVGGTNAAITSWPSIAFLLAGWDSDGNGSIDAAASCTGTVIAPTWILTAAHCAFQPNGQGIDAMVTVTGKQDATDPAAEVIPVDQLVVNPGYNTGTLKAMPCSST